MGPLERRVKGTNRAVSSKEPSFNFPIRKKEAKVMLKAFHAALFKIFLILLSHKKFAAKYNMVGPESFKWPFTLFKPVKISKRNAARRFKFITVAVK